MLSFYANKGGMTHCETTALHRSGINAYVQALGPPHRQSHPYDVLLMSLDVPPAAGT